MQPIASHVALFFAVGCLLIAAACSSTNGAPPAAPPLAAAADAPPMEPTESVPRVKLGNGEKSWIVTDGMTRNGSSMTFREVQIQGNGYLVLHPFKDGKPVGDIYVGSTYITDGMNRNVEITVESGIEKGEMFIVMLHNDVNENQEFDFVFVDERNVLDKAVFEGTTMIAHAIAAP